MKPKSAGNSHSFSPSFLLHTGDLFCFKWMIASSFASFKRVGALKGLLRPYKASFSVFPLSPKSPPDRWSDEENSLPVRIAFLSPCYLRLTCSLLCNKAAGEGCPELPAPQSPGVCGGLVSTLCVLPASVGRLLLDGRSHGHAVPSVHGRVGGGGDPLVGRS